MKNKKIFFIALLVFLIDRLSKIFIVNLNIEYHSIIKNILSITPTINTGAAFSILQNQQTFLIIISCFAFLYLFKLFNKSIFKLPLQIAWGFVLGGALGNFFDRVFYGFVFDFIRFEPVYFPVFNFADAFITIGVIIIFHYYLFGEKKLHD